MAIVAHPDDIEFGFAGTVAAWTKRGCKFCYVLCTSGDVGIAEEGMTRDRATEIREREQRAAAAVAGVEEVIFLREPDGMVENTMALRKRLVREIRRFRPEVVLTTDPTVLWVSENYINHPDHRAVGGAAVDAVFPAAGQPNLFEDLAAEGLRAHKIRKLYVRGPGTTHSDHVVDITGVMDVKIDALKQHASQLVDWDPAPMLREWAGKVAEDQPFEFGEAWKVVALVSDEDWEKLKGERW
jgi:LmbE family N-acetylglucosaminyl deacetylase